MSDLTPDIIVLWRLGFTGQEIADVSGLTCGAVMGRLGRAYEFGNITRMELRRRVEVGHETRRQRRLNVANAILSFGI